MPLSPSLDTQMMRLACAEARKWLGATSPNPAVGAVACDKDGNLLAVSAHHKAGEGHAEANLLAACREKNILSRIHTLYVTLEPCNHQGRTPPCTEAIIQADIPRIVIGTRDPNPHVTGCGFEHLRQAGIDVISGVNEEECKQLIHAFSYRQQTGMPWITIKRAFDAHGSMIPPSGQKTFSSADSLLLAHRLRKKCDVLMTGSGTILADHPLFTVRHTTDYPDKRRMLAILDRRGRVPESYVQSASLNRLDSHIYDDIDVAIDDLIQKGAQDILVEAGPALSQSLFDRGLWTMSVTVQKNGSGPDRVTVAFNPSAAIPFDRDRFDWAHFLPD